MLHDDYKLVVDGTRGAGAELFDLRGDTAERHDLAAVEPDVLQDLRQRLRAWQESVLQSLTGADYR